MQEYCNIPEGFIRELKGILIYDSAAITYEDQFAHQFPKVADSLYQFRVVPGEHSRSVPTKQKEGNFFFSPDISLSLVDMDISSRNIWYEKFNRKNSFAVILVSNTEMMMLGNDRFPLSISISDAMRDDGSGNDSFQLNIYGDTILYPRLYKIVDRFKVIFFIPPLL